MDTLDLLISKFKEAKEELAKSDTSTNSVAQTVEELEKYMSPFFMFGSSKKNTAPAAPAKPARLTGSDKIAAVSKETIRPTSVNRDGTPAPGPAPKPPKLTGLDRIKAESQRPITKSEKDLLKQDTADSKFINVRFGKSINGSYDGAVNQGGMVKGCEEKVSLNKGGQWSILDKAVRGEDWAPDVTNKKNNPSLGGKTGKIHGGDPRKAVEPHPDDSPEKIMHVPGASKFSGQESHQAITNVNGKPRKLVSGASTLRRDNKVRHETEVKKAEDHDEKGRCTSCGNKACVGQDCKVDHEANALKANAKQNEGFKNKIKGLPAKDGVLKD